MMNDQEQYMADFMKVFSTLERWGPGSESETQKALTLLPKEPEHILEIGCGKGLATQVLIDHSRAMITAIDNEQSALDRLQQRFTQQGISDRLQTTCASMTELPFAKEIFDLIWAEGSAYIMGVEKALADWKPLLKAHGYVMLSDMVWRTEQPSKESIAFWQQEYPDIQLVSARIQQMQQAGYLVVGHFPMSDAAWMSYYAPLQNRLVELASTCSETPAYQDIKREVEICTQFKHEFGYHMFILQKV